ncbi:septation protein A [Castellaniella hirudinis]|uniref:septation protein A n=1 Tax=Castellaniella hirudinis TaxID=1144617 RepID=UPI0039C3E536
MKKFLFDLFPLILFFLAYKLGDSYVGKDAAIYVATGIAIVAAVLQILWLALTRRKIEATHWINVSIITVFGGATILLHDDTFIKWKPTVLYWLFAAILLGSRLFAGRNLMRRLMGEKIALPDPAWARLNDSWAAFFTLSGALNLYVAFSGQFTESQWVDFKVFGLTILLVIFVIVQSLWLGRHIQAPPDTPTDRAPANPRDPS